MFAGVLGGELVMAQLVAKARNVLRPIHPYTIDILWEGWLSSGV